MTIEHNAVDPSIVEFVLRSANNITWWKQINIPDGGGNSWNIATWEDAWPGTNRVKEARESLWAGQVHNGQQLTFSKAKFLGAHTDVYTLGNLEILQPGDRVTFEWIAD